MRDGIVHEMIGADARLIHLFRTSALFKANLVAFAEYVLPAYLEGLAVQAEKYGEDYERRLHDVMNAAPMSRIYTEDQLKEMNL